MIDRDTCSRELARLSALPGFNFVQEPGLAAIMDAMQRFFDDARKLHEAITEMLYTVRTMIAPADIRDAGLRLCPPKSAHDPNCADCDGTGWLEVERHGQTGVERCGCGTFTPARSRGETQRQKVKNL